MATVWPQAARARFTPLSGGRTNRLWRFGCGGADHVCKLYRPDAATPLFPNDPRAEALALAAAGTAGLSPAFCFALSCESGAAIVYNYLEANSCRPDPSDVARALARLHELPPPAGLTARPSGAAAILEQGDAMLRELSQPEAGALARLRPVPVATGAAESVFLHGDVVPANAISTRDGVRFIDWQCPAVGDPVGDLAIYLSPAMQYLYGGAPMAPKSIRRFLDAYGHSERANRYLALAPAFHWRMAAYCLWKASRGDADYKAGLDLELAWLKDLR